MIRQFSLVGSIVLLVTLLSACVALPVPDTATQQDEAAAEVDATAEPVEETDENEVTNTIEATFVCPDGTSLPTVFDNDARTVTVDLPDGAVTLPQVESGSGAKYSDGTTTFWNKGDEAMVEVDGEAAYKGCMAQN